MGAAQHIENRFSGSFPLVASSFLPSFSLLSATASEENKQGEDEHEHELGLELALEYKEEKHKYVHAYAHVCNAHLGCSTQGIRSKDRACLVLAHPTWRKEKKIYEKKKISIMQGFFQDRPGPYLFAQGVPHKSGPSGACHECQLELWKKSCTFIAVIVMRRYLIRACTY